MTLQAAGEAGNTLSYAEVTGRASYVPPEDDGLNAGRAYAENTQVEAAAKPDAATKRHEWAAKQNDEQIKSGQDTQKVGNGIAMAGSVIATIGGFIAIVGGPVGIVVGAVVALIGAIIGIIGGVVSAVGQGQVEEATGEKNAHLDQVNKGVNDAQNAGEQAKMLNKKNQIDVYRQKEKSLDHEIVKQEEYMQTLDPETQPQKYKSAQKDLERMNTTKGKYQTHISEYEASASGQGTIPPTADAPPPAVDPALSMSSTSSATGDASNTTASATTDVASNPSGTTTASASSAPPPTTTTTVAAPVQ